MLTSMVNKAVTRVETAEGQSMTENQSHSHSTTIAKSSNAVETNEKVDGSGSSRSSSTNNAENVASMYNTIEGLQPWRRALIFFGLCLGLLLALMDSSIIATAIYTIALDFNSLAKALWAILAYQLTYLGFSVVFTRVSDFTGRRAAVLAAFTLFLGFSLACGWSSNIDQLIAFRTVQGIGGAGLYSLSIVLLIEASTPRLIPYTTSLIGATISISGVLGPIIGGVLTQYVSWRWVFWINGPCGAVAVICFTLGWPNATKPPTGNKRRFSEFDWPGALLILAASILVVFGLEEGGSGVYQWNSPMVLGTLISGVVSWILLLAWEYYVYRNLIDTIASMFPFTILTSRVLVAAIINTMCTGFSFFLVIISLPLRFQIVNLRSPAAAGVHLLPLLCSTGVGGALGGMASSRKNNTKVWQTFIVSAALVLLGVGLMTTLSPGTDIQAKTYVFQTILGVGVGATFSAISVLTASTAGRQDHAVAQGIHAQLRVFGGSIGLAMSNAMFSNTCRKNLVGILTPDQIRDLQTNTRILGQLGDAQREAVRLAYATGFRHSLLVCVGVAAVGFVAGCATVDLMHENRERVNERK